MYSNTPYLGSILVRKQSRISMSAELNHEVSVVIDEYERIIGRAASRTHQVIESLGVVEALSKLVVSADLQQGFNPIIS